MSTVKFPLGRLLATRTAASIISPADVAEAIRRHSYGDWGEVCKEDRAENEFSLEHGFRIMSIYTSSDGVRFWIITEADRSSTTVLLPEDY